MFFKPWGAGVQASAMSAQPTPQASLLTANGQASRADAPGDPSSPPLVQEGSAARSEGAAGAEQEPLPNGVCSGVCCSGPGVDCGSDPSVWLKALQCCQMAQAE